MSAPMSVLEYTCSRVMSTRKLQESCTSAAKSRPDQIDACRDSFHCHYHSAIEVNADIEKLSLEADIITPMAGNGHLFSYELEEGLFWRQVNTPAYGFLITMQD